MAPPFPPLRTPMSPNSNPKPNRQLFLSLILALILTLTVFLKNRWFWAVLSAVWPKGQKHHFNAFTLGPRCRQARLGFKIVLDCVTRGVFRSIENCLTKIGQKKVQDPNCFVRNKQCKCGLHVLTNLTVVFHLYISSNFLLAIDTIESDGDGVC